MLYTYFADFLNQSAPSNVIQGVPENMQPIFLAITITTLIISLLFFNKFR